MMSAVVVHGQTGKGSDMFVAGWWDGFGITASTGSYIVLGALTTLSALAFLYIIIRLFFLEPKDSVEGHRVYWE